MQINPAINPYLVAVYNLTTAQLSKKLRITLTAFSVLFIAIDCYGLILHPNHDILYKAISLPLMLGIAIGCYLYHSYTTYLFCALLFLSIFVYTEHPNAIYLFSFFCTPIFVLLSNSRQLLFLGISSIFFSYSDFNSELPIVWFFSSTASFFFYYVLPLALRIVYEQKQATARAYTDYQTQVQETNLALARELHDTVARHISLINLTTGQALIHPNPSATQAALHTIDTSARQALADLRLLIQTTRTGPTNTDLPSQPASETDLAHSLTTATESLRNQGFTLTTDIRIQPNDIPTGLHPTLHKIIQEISFNASKYATPGSTITLTAKPNLTGITITTTNPTTSTPINHKKPGTGYGLVGITERVTRLGGTIRYGTSKGTWNLTIHLPIIRA